MGKLQVFEVIFDDGDLFRAGEWVQGHVRIVLSEAKNDIRGIEITYVGKSKTKWHESEGHGEKRETNPYYSKEKYFEEKMLILGKTKQDSSGEKVHLGMGEHKFPFRFQIPATILPHPIEGQYGYVRYKVKAKIDRPLKFDHTTQRLFSVVGNPVDLNMIPQALIPSKNEDVKNVCCLCCAKPVMCSAQTDKGGYVPGETIWVSGMIDNKTSRGIVDVTAKLKQKITFRARKHGKGPDLHTRHQKKVLCKVKGDGCGDHRKVYFDRKPLVVPSCPPSFLAGCDIIHIEYYVEFSADITITPFDADVKLPIVIGSVPLDSDSYSTYAAAHPPGHVITQQPSAPPDALPPPLYEVAMGGPHEMNYPSNTYS